LTIGALMLTAPVAMLERLMPEELPLRFAACSGRLLRSGTCQVFLRGNSGWLSAGAVSYEWGFKPDPGVHLTLQQDGRRAGTLQPSFNGWQAKSIDLRMPMMLPDVLPKNSMTAWQLTARQVISVPALACDWRASNCTGRARIDVIDLVIGQFGRDPVGSYRMDLELVQGGRLIGHLSTLSGPLTLDGLVEKSPASGMQILGRARLGSGVTDDIRELLANIARREDANTFAYSFP
jgi:hypothetical protein